MDILASMAGPYRHRHTLNRGSLADGDGGTTKQRSLRQRPDGVGARRLWKTVWYLPPTASKRRAGEAWLSQARGRLSLSNVPPSARASDKPNVYPKVRIVPHRACWLASPGAHGRSDVHAMPRRSKAQEWHFALCEGGARVKQSA